MLTFTKKISHSYISKTLSSAAVAESSKTSKRFYAVQPLAMPALSPTMTSGTITKWHVKPGQRLQPGEVLCSVQTDKAVVEMDTQEDLIVGKILVPEGTEDVKLGEVICLVCDNEKDLKDVDSFVLKKAESAPSSAPSSSSTTASSSSSSAPSTSSSSSQKPSSQFIFLDPPSVRHFLESYGIDRSEIPSASGKNGRISKEDIVKFKSSDKFKQLEPKKKAPSSITSTTEKTSGPAPTGRPRPAKFEDIPASLTRKIIATRLLESKQQLPHFYMSTEANIDKLLAYRDHLKSKGIKVSVNDMIIKLSGRALEMVPQCNSVFNPKTGEHEVKEAIDISVAVATEGGLITPIVKNANRKTVENISSDVKSLAGRARSGGLKPEEFQGGSFCISNLGMFGIKNFEAVINPPQALILAVGGSEKRAYLETQDELNDKFGFNQSFDLSLLDDVDPATLNNGTGVPKTATYITLTVSADARAVDGKDVGDFLSALRDLLEMRTAF